MAFFTIRRSLMAIGVLGLLLLVDRAPAANAQVPDIQDLSFYTEFTVSAATATYQAPDLNSPQIGFVQAGETIDAVPGVVIGDDGVAFLRCRRASGEDLGYCPVSGTDVAGTVTAATPIVPTVVSPFSGLALVPGATVVTPGLVSQVCNAFGQCFIPGAGMQISTIDFDR